MSKLTALRGYRSLEDEERRNPAGAIVTFVDGSVRHYPGRTRAAVRAALDDGEIRTISTPRTIFADLQREPSRSYEYTGVRPSMPEPKLIGKARLLP